LRSLLPATDHAAWASERYADGTCIDKSASAFAQSRSGGEAQLAREVEPSLRGRPVPLSVGTDGEDLEDVVAAAQMRVVLRPVPAASIPLIVELAAELVRRDAIAAPYWNSADLVVGKIVANSLVCGRG
jgi:hypothetical protein